MKPFNIESCVSCRVLSLGGQHKRWRDALIRTSVGFVYIYSHHLLVGGYVVYLTAHHAGRDWRATHPSKSLGRSAELGKLAHRFARQVRAEAARRQEAKRI